MPTFLGARLCGFTLTMAGLTADRTFGDRVSVWPVFWTGAVLAWRSLEVRLPFAWSGCVPVALQANFTGVVITHCDVGH